MFKIAICDDEKYFGKKIKQILEAYMEQNHISYDITVFTPGKEVIELGIEIMKYQMIFLDINMEQIDGIETAEYIRKYTEECFIVFVTAYIDYTLEGYSVGAVRYLLKGTENFTESMYECLDTIFDKMNHTKVIRKIQFNEGAQAVPLNRILYIESRLHKLEYHIMEDELKVYTCYGKLNEIEKEYDKNGFIRLHQSFLVNMHYIERIERYQALLSNGMKIPIPRARYQFVEDSFIEYRGEI